MNRLPHYENLTKDTFKPRSEDKLCICQNIIFSKAKKLLTKHWIIYLAQKNSALNNFFKHFSSKPFVAAKKVLFSYNVYLIFFVNWVIFYLYTGHIEDRCHNFHKNSYKIWLAACIILVDSSPEIKLWRSFFLSWNFSWDFTENFWNLYVPLHSPSTQTISRRMKEKTLKDWSNIDKRDSKVHMEVL